MYGLLDGIRVVEVASWVFVPSAAAILADWGADVVKIEDPVHGDPLRGLFNALTPPGGPNPLIDTPNRGKRSVGVDLKSPEGRDVVARLLASADVFITNFRADALERLGLGLDAVREVNPRIVYVRGSGYGTAGPDADKGGFDTASAWSRAGIAYQMTQPGGEPPVMPAAMCDLVAGLTAAGGVAAALLHRERTGEATEVDVSLLGVGMWMAAQAIGAGRLGVDALPTSRRRPLNPIANQYRTKDDRWIQLMMLQADRWWPDLCRVVGRPDLVDDPRFADARLRQEHTEECIRELDAVFETRTLDEWRVALADAEGVWDVLQSPIEVGRDEQALVNGYLPEIEHWDGTAYRTVASPVQFGQRAVGELRPGPEHGQHTEEVLLELGFDWDGILGLKQRGAVL